VGRLADRPRARARGRRRSFPIHGYVGPNGTGKSAIMVYDTLPSLRAGRPVLSTVRLLDFENPRECDDPLCTYSSHGLPGHLAAHPLYVPFTSYTQLLAWRDGDVLMDEVTGVASSRESGSMPVQVANFLSQLRRRNIALRWSAPAWGRADKIIREVSQGVTLMSASMPRLAPPTDDGTPRLWHQRRLFCARTYDPVRMDEFEAHRAEDIPHEVIAFYWGPRSTMFRAYDTLDAVTSLGWASESGMCMHCGGKRALAKCDCEDHKRKGPVEVPDQRRPRRRRHAEMHDQPVELDPVAGR
jgi:hypothetical protein